MEDEPTDASLVQRARQGDRAAFAALVERYQQPLGGYLWRLTRDRELASDLTQEAFLHAYRSISATSPGLLVRPWLYRIATNLAYDEFRRLRRSGRLLRVGVGRPGVQVESSLIEERELVQLTLDCLRPSDKAVLLLCAVEQLTYPEVGVILGRSAEAVRKQFARAKERFRLAYSEVPPKSLPRASRPSGLSRSARSRPERGVG